MKSKKALNETEIITKTTKIAKIKITEFYKAINEKWREMLMKSRKALGETQKITKTTKIAKITKFC